MLLVHLTDLHFGCEDKAALKAAERFVAETHPDVVVVSGDISRDGLQCELDAACAWMRELSSPVLLTPGNHDVPYFNPIGRLIAPWKRFNRAAQGIRTTAWHTERFSLIPINTARGWQLRLNWAQGAMSRGQAALAAAELQRCAPGALRIVVTHHPLDWPNDAPIKGVTRGGLRGQEACVSAGADIFLSGHLHFASARLIGTRALSITSGTLSQRVRHEPCAFTAVRRLAPDLIETEVLHVIQGVAETASRRQFKLERPPAPGVNVAVHAEAD